MRFELQRTGKRIKFTDVAIGNPFFAHGKMWTRTSYSGATQMASSGWHASSCSFDLDPWDKYVEYVLYVVEEADLPDAYKRGPVPDLSMMEDLKPEDDPKNYPKEEDDA